MAIGRLSMKVGKAGKASAHSSYISRTGEYAKYTERGEKLEASEAGNMPAWAEKNPNLFWQAADANERKNGTTYREMEIALPRELTPDQRLELVHDFIRQEIGERHAYQFAIHVPTAADGGEQPHVHLMFSERQRDGIERDPDQYFKRYNGKYPERGGAKKGYGEKAGQTLTRAERTAELKALRGRWEGMCNSHLEKAGHGSRIDMRSYKDQGIDLAPEKKLLPSQWKDPQQRAQILEYREAKADLSKTEIVTKAILQERPHNPLEPWEKAVEKLTDKDFAPHEKVKANAELKAAKELVEQGKNPLHHLSAIQQAGQQAVYNWAKESVRANAQRPKVQTPKEMTPEEAQTVLKTLEADASERAKGYRQKADLKYAQLHEAIDQIDRNRKAMIKKHLDVQPVRPERPRGFLADIFGIGMKAYEQKLDAWEKEHRQWSQEHIQVQHYGQDDRSALERQQRELSGYLSRNHFGQQGYKDRAYHDAARDLLATDPVRAKQVEQAKGVIDRIAKEREQARELQKDCKALGEKVYEAAKLHQKGKLKDVPPALSQVLDKVAAMPGSSRQKIEALAQDFIQASASTRADWKKALEPYQRQINRTMDRGGMSL
ncbi:TPA: MobA/MobL family protein [Escherichia coli]|nr:MobA/MobL family protein [Escherichia coli]